MLIYVDNNILIDYEKGLKCLFKKEDIKYVYSYVHLQELLESGDKLEEIRERRVRSLERLTQCRYVGNDNSNIPRLYIGKPVDILKTFDSPLSKLLSQQIHEATAHWKVDESPKFLMEQLGIEKKVVNNYTPEMLVEKYGDIILYYIARTCILRQEVFQSLFNILDALGFWQDRVKAGSTMNRSYDANHAYFATACDYFVTEDKNTRNKANVAYRLYGYRTRAVSFEEYCKIVEKGD